MERIYILFFFRGNINLTLCIKLHTLFKRNCLEFYLKTLTHFYFTLHDIIGLLWTLENINRKLKLRTTEKNNNNRKLNKLRYIDSRQCNPSRRLWRESFMIVMKYYKTIKRIYWLSGWFESLNRYRAHMSCLTELS